MILDCSNFASHMLYNRSTHTLVTVHGNTRYSKIIVTIVPYHPNSPGLGEQEQ